jgi:hypothetical protein
MTQKCELLDTCRFFLRFSSNLEVIKKQWVILYCENVEYSDGCERKKNRNQTGEPPVDNMAPTGVVI